MGVNKVDLSTGETLIDISKDTVTPQTLTKGYTAHNAQGEPIVGALVTEGGGGSGIIDVTELPTENIDENAVYRVTESYKSADLNVWAVMPDEETGELAPIPLAYLLEAECEFYTIDSLEDAVVTDGTAEDIVYAINVLRIDGIAYIFFPEILGETPLPLGFALFEVEDLDKGYTDNIYLETEMGIYTTREQYDTFQRWFIRENGEWKEITAYIYVTYPLGITKVNMLTGDITPIAYSASDLLSRTYTEINENWFLKADGSYVDRIQMNMFAASNSLKVATLPSFITRIFGDIFSGCGNLKVVTLKGKPDYISNYAFRNSYNDAITTINVPWAEGEVQGAPWGATNATINYNYTEG